MIQLSPNQSRIVTAPIDKPIQVLASAGSGKTRVLTERIRYILDHSKKDGVIALTFTNKAADEMNARLADLDELKERTWISTIHSVAQRILEKYGHTIGLPAELHIYDRDKDRMEVFLQSLRDEGFDIDDYLDISDPKEKKNREKVMQKYMDAFSIIKRELLMSEDEIANRFPDSDRLWKMYKDYQKALLDSGGIDYDDILIKAYELLQAQAWVGDVYRAKYKHLCVDEAQDLNKAQYEFVKILCGDTIKSVLMVGDPNQMIYGFNSSSSDFLCNLFVQDFSPECFKLIENYRCSKAVIRAANKLKPNSQKESEAALEGLLEVNSFLDEEKEAVWVAEKIKQLLDLKKHNEIEGEISLEQMVVIARNKFVFPELEKKLAEKNIPYSLKKGERSSEANSFFGKVLDYAIRIKLNPKDWVYGKKLCELLKLKYADDWGDDDILKAWANASKLSKIPLPDLQADLLLEISELSTEDPNIRKFVNKFNKKLKEIAESNGIADKVKDELERSIVDLSDFQKMWTRFKQQGVGGSLQAFRNSLALGQLSEDVVEGGLTLSTVHTMKGLEKEIVFLVGMCEGVFPDYRAIKPAEITEERNSAFVAVTRAKRWLYISYPQTRLMPWGDKKYQSVSRFVTEIQRT